MGKTVNMDSEKFSLKWNDFQQTVSNSFGILRKEQDFFDVTLVSDDEVHLSSHKLMLSACSEFFKPILKKTSNPHPLIYLSGISSRNLQYILDYIYHGEVEIYLEQLDDFLDVGQKLKVAGLNSYSKQETEVIKQKSCEKPIYQSLNKENSDGKASPPFSKPPMEKVNFPVMDLANMEVSEQEEKIKEMIDVSDGVFSCKICGKTSNKKFIVQQHLETHITGLSLPCTQCGKTFRNRTSLQRHICSKAQKVIKNCLEFVTFDFDRI